MNSDDLNETCAGRDGPLTAAYGEFERRFAAEADAEYDPCHGLSEILRRVAERPAGLMSGTLSDEANDGVDVEAIAKQVSRRVGDRLLFAVLGQFEVLNDDGPVEVVGGTARALLVALLLRPAGYVSAGQLIGAVWGEPGATSEDNLYHHISRLRRTLAPLGLRITAGQTPKVRYRIAVPDAMVDVRRFEDLVASAGRLVDTEPTEALNRLREAVVLWRGSTAFPELHLPGVRALGHRLDVARLAAEERLAELEVQFGDPERAVDRLRALAVAHPGRTGVVAALLKVLHATGRGRDAEQVYRQAVQRHGHRLPARVEQAHRPRVNDDLRVPIQVPAAARHFTARSEELGRLVTNHDAGTVISAVNGMAGVGKTALVLHAAHQMIDAGQFPDGALFIGLRGASSQPPMEPAAALETLLRGLGLAGSQVPAQTDARAALYRTILARRRVLIVLDDAHDEAQVRPLLPGTANCRVLVTSRRRLAGLDDADQINLDVLGVPEAIWLFRATVGAHRDPGDDQAIEEVVRLCGLLPLAVRIAGARLTTSRTLTTDRLLAQLQTEQDRLTVLDDGARSVEAALGVSYRDLPVGQQRAFAVLGQHPGLEFDAHAAAAMLDATPARARGLLDALDRVNLLEQPAPGRRQFHCLVRVYAAARIGITPDRRVALDRLYRYYAIAASAAMDVLYPFETVQRPRPANAGNPIPDFDDQSAARAWLEAELDNLLACAHHATDNGHPEHTVHQSATLHRHLRTCAKYDDANALHKRALNAARTQADSAAELDALTALGHIHRLQRRHDLATNYLQQALDIAASTSDPHTELNARNGLGQVHYMRGAYGSAADCFRETLQLARTVGNQPGELDALTGLGHVQYVQGKQRLAASYYTRALDLARATGNTPCELDALIGLAYTNYSLDDAQAALTGFDHALELARATVNQAGELNTLTGLGHVHQLEGHYRQADARYSQALALAAAIGDRYGQLDALTGLGRVHQLQNRYQPAAGYYEQVLQLARAGDNRNYQFDAHLGLGQVYQGLSESEQAIHSFLLALQLARELGQILDEARALDGLAHSHHALGQFDQARQHWQHALQILTDNHLSATGDVTTTDIDASLTNLDTATRRSRTTSDALTWNPHGDRGRPHPVRRRDRIAELVGSSWPYVDR